MQDGSEPSIRFDDMYCSDSLSEEKDNSDEMRRLEKWNMELDIDEDAEENFMLDNL